MSSLEEALEGVLIRYGVPAELDGHAAFPDGADRGDLAGALASEVEKLVQVAYLGGRFRDALTGFTGAAVGVWYKVGACQVQLAELGGDGKIREAWIDSPRLEVVDDDAQVGFR